MKQLCSAVALSLALAACQKQPIGDHTSKERPSGAERTPEVTAPMPPTSGQSGQQNAPYSGYPGPVGKTDAGAPDAGPTVAPADAGPPSTSMPGARPQYPDAGAPKR